MKIALGNDHAGCELKELIKDYLNKGDYEWEDFGTFDDASVDYPDYAFYVGNAIQKGECDLGILICGTGIGISIAANKMAGIRAALCHDLFSAEATRMHNDSNILAMGARVVDFDLAIEIVDKWLNTEFEGGRHQKRIDKITAIEDMMAVERAEELVKIVNHKEL